MDLHLIGARERLAPAQKWVSPPHQVLHATVFAHPRKLSASLMCRHLLTLAALVLLVGAVIWCRLQWDSDRLAPMNSGSLGASTIDAECTWTPTWMRTAVGTMSAARDMDAACKMQHATQMRRTQTHKIELRAFSMVPATHLLRIGRHHQA